MGAIATEDALDHTVLQHGLNRNVEGYGTHLGNAADSTGTDLADTTWTVDVDRLAWRAYLLTSVAIQRSGSPDTTSVDPAGRRQVRFAEKYEVLNQIGRGGMGVVYRVRHVDLGTIQALKVLPREVSGDTDLVERFRREAQLMARLDHPHIVRVHDFASYEDLYFLTMEFVAGEDLSQHLTTRHRPLDLTEVLRIGRQIAEALAYAHAQAPPIVHRDIKPSNVLIEQGTGRIALTDFGIAKLLDDSEQGLTKTGRPVGTMRYCAPEQMRRDPNLDGRVDLYSLGLVLYELYTGDHLYAGLADEEIIGRVLYGRDEDLPAFLGAQPEFAQIIAHCIARDRDLRYPTADALLEELQECAEVLAEEDGHVLAELGSASPPTEDAPSAPEASATPASAATPEAVSESADSRHPSETTSGGTIIDWPRRLRHARRWLAARLLPLTVALPASIVALVCVLEGPTWMGRTFPGFVVMANRVIASSAAYHWTGMEAGIPFHGMVTGVDGTPIAEGNDVYRAVERHPPGTALTYTVTKGEASTDVTVSTMEFALLDYVLTFGLLHLNGILIILMGTVVGLLTPRNRMARVFLVMCVLMGLYPLTGSDLWRAHKFMTLQFALQCITPALFIHLALVFPIERAIRGFRRVILVAAYAFGIALTGLLLRGFWATPPDLAPLHVSYAFTAIGLLAIVAGSIVAYVRERRSVVRGRVQVVLIGVVAAFLLPIFGFLDNTLGGGHFPLNLVALTPVLFFLAVAYAIVKHRLFDVQIIVRRGVLAACMLGIATLGYVALVTTLNVLLGRADAVHSPVAMGILMTISVASALSLRDRLSATIEARLFPHKRRFHETLQRVSQAISGMTELGAVLDEVSKALEAGTPISAGSILVRTSGNAAFTTAARFGHSAGNGVIPAGSPLARLLDATRYELFLEDLEEDPSLASLRDECIPMLESLGAHLLIPVLGREDLVGVLALGETERRDAITSEDLALLRSLAAGIGLAIQRRHDTQQVALMERQRTILTRHLPSLAARRDVTDHTPAEVHRRPVTRLCTRLGDYDEFADRAEPRVALDLLQSYYEAFAESVQRHSGIVECWDGSHAIALFGAVGDVADHTECATRAALEAREWFPGERFAGVGYGFAVACGLASGTVAIGTLDDTSDSGPTAVGTSLRLAAQLCEHAAPGIVLAPGAMQQEIAAHFLTTPVTDQHTVDATNVDAVSIEPQGRT